MGERRRVDVVGGLALTLGVHVALAVLVLLLVPPNRAGAEVRYAAIAVVDPPARWGEELPDSRDLPTLANPAPGLPSAESEVSLATPEEQVAPEPGDAERTPAELRRRDEPSGDTTRSDRGPTNDHRPTNTDPITGYEDGVIGGTHLSPIAVRNMLAGIQGRLQAAFSPPRLSDEELAGLTARVHVTIDADGRIVDYVFLERSGNALFDARVEIAINRFRSGSSRLRLSSVADEGLRARILAEGFDVPVGGL